MPISIQFQYQPDPTRRPNDESDHNDPVDVEEGQVALIPDVGDTVTYGSYEYDYEPNGKLIETSGREVTVARKVITRHFAYHGGKLIFVNVCCGGRSKRRNGDAPQGIAVSPPKYPEKRLCFDKRENI